ncbi:MAG: NAD(+) synthase [Lentisphaeria bacterium]|nr:NAD(+) synthase [Lentisphaeria bacterium]
MFDIFRIASLLPDLRCADVVFNREAMKECYRQSVASGASLVLLPAMAVTGKSCGDLFTQIHLLSSAMAAAEDFAAITGEVPAVFGLPELVNGKLLECAAVAQSGKIIAHVVRRDPDLPGFSGEVPQIDGFYAAGQVFDGRLSFSVNFAGDTPVFPGGEVQLYCGAEPEVPGAQRRRENFFKAVSDSCGSVTAASFAGSMESTSDQVYGGALLICQSGKILASRPAPAAGTGAIYADIDREKILFAQLKRSLPSTCPVKIAGIPQAPDFRYLDNPAHPFLPDDPEERGDFFRETFALQCTGLAERFKRCGAKRMVLGISGGLDSTLALVVMAMVCKEQGLPSDTILAVTMPGFGTTGRTRNNALLLAELLGAEIREIPIGKACMQHFADIGHDPEVTNSVYENSQARERTQILMDVANGVNGIVIGTGDLSEIALGWSTFNGDQMAMYAVNGSIPKSNIAPMLEYAASQLPGSRDILMDVINTPVSPELLPAGENGEILQKTEAVLGAYELHDYYLYNFMHGIGAPDKLLALAKAAFGEVYPQEELIRVRELFMRRFFTQQFKRTAGPDGVQAGVISLSGRTSWRMGADISGKLWRNN